MSTSASGLPGCRGTATTMHDFDRIQTNMRQRMRSMLRGMLNDGTTLPRGISRLIRMASERTLPQRSFN